MTDTRSAGHDPSRAGISRGEPVATAPPAENPIVIDGHCIVTLAEQQKWSPADPKWGAIHRGKTYLFRGPAEQQRFLANPDAFGLVLSGYDAVRLAETGEMVDGKRQHGVFFHDQIYLFADEAALQRFYASPERYAGAAQQALQSRASQTLRR